jgi:hypothetical protein
MLCCAAPQLAKNARNLVRETGRAEAKLPADGGPVQPGLADRYDPAACMWHWQAPLAGGSLRRLPPPRMGGGGGVGEVIGRHWLLQVITVAITGYY